MNSRTKLSKKQWSILEYFIEQESACMGACKEGAPLHRFKTIAYKIEQELDISRVGARDICEKLKEYGFFESTEEWSDHQRTTHYALHPKLPLPCIRLLVLGIRDYYSLPEQIAFMALAYVGHQINLALVNNILAEKGVSITRSIDILDWDPREVLGVAATCNYINGETLQAINHKEFARGEIAQAEARSSDFSSFMLHPVYVLSFPIVPSELSPTERFFRVQERNRDFFNENPDLAKFRSGFDQPYGNFLEKRLLTPILALIRISPSALCEFVCGTWESFEIRYAYGIIITPPWGSGVPCNLLFSLVALAVADISRTMEIPRSSMVEDAFVRSGLPGSTSQKKGALLVLCLNDGYDLCFDYHFSTRKLLPDRRPPMDPSHTVSVTYSFRDDGGASQTRLCHSSIRDPLCFLAELRNTKNPVSRHLQQMFSNRMRNLLQYYDPEVVPSYRFMECLIEEINHVFLREDFFDLELFSRSEVSKETLEFVGHIHEYDSDSWIWIQRTNRYLFDEAYFGLIEDSRDPDAGIKKQSFEPVVDEKSLVLVIGAFPSKSSLVDREYYADPDNMFWKMMEQLCKIPRDATYEERLAALRSNYIALWDLLAWAVCDGTVRHSIVDYAFNDIVGLLKQYPNIRAVVLNGIGEQSPEMWFEEYRKGLSEEDRHVLESRHIEAVICSGPENRGEFERKRLEWVEKVWGRTYMYVKPKNIP